MRIRKFLIKLHFPIFNATKGTYNNIILSSSILLLICLLILHTNTIYVLGAAAPITDTKEKLEKISDEEKAVLENLFTLTQEIEQVKKEKDELITEVNYLKKEYKKLEERIMEQQIDYDSKLSILMKILIRYQR